MYSFEPLAPQSLLCTGSSRQRERTKHFVPAFPDHRGPGEEDHNGQHPDAFGGRDGESGGGCRIGEDEPLGDL